MKVLEIEVLYSVVCILCWCILQSKKKLVFVLFLFFFVLRLTSLIDFYKLARKCRELLVVLTATFKDTMKFTSP